jgi:hypothetical protein
MKTFTLTGIALDWAVAKAEGLLEPKEFFGKMVAPVVLDMEYWSNGEPMVRLNPCPDVYYRAEYDPSTDWKHGGPIIECEVPMLMRTNGGDWIAQGSYDTANDKEAQRYYGPTPLVAAMRCYVASKLGDDVDVPEELT